MYGLFLQLALLRAMVTDGVTVGHPCCAILNCEIPLTNQRHRYCPTHLAEESKCSIIGCNNQCEQGFKTCIDTEHRQREKDHYEAGSSFGHLLRRARKAGICQPEDVTSTEPVPTRVNFDGVLQPNVGSESGLIDIDSTTYTNENTGEDEENGMKMFKTVLRDLHTATDPVCDNKPDAGNQRVKTQFSRRWSHCEQLCVCPCGTVIARKTFYGSEGPRNVVVCHALFSKCAATNT
jgi:hypothetical protein